MTVQKGIVNPLFGPWLFVLHDTDLPSPLSVALDLAKASIHLSHCLTIYAIVDSDRNILRSLSKHKFRGASCWDVKASLGLRKQRALYCGRSVLPSLFTLLYYGEP